MKKKKTTRTRRRRKNGKRKPLMMVGTAFGGRERASGEGGDIFPKKGQASVVFFSEPEA